MEPKFIKYKDKRKCLYCQKEITDGYDLSNSTGPIRLCADCFKDISKCIDPNDITAGSVNKLKGLLTLQNVYRDVALKEYSSLEALKCAFNDKEYFFNEGFEKTQSYKKIDGKWQIVNEKPILYLRLQEFSVLFFSEIMRIFYTRRPIVYNIAINEGLRAESVFVHSNENDITKGIENLCFCGETIYETEEGTKTQIIMARVHAIYNSRRIILSEKYNLKFKKECPDIKSWVYYTAFQQALNQKAKTQSNTAKSIVENIYRNLEQVANKYNFDLGTGRAREESKEEKDYSNSSVNIIKRDALSFFGLEATYSLKELKKKRNEMLKKYHPDNAGTDMEKFTEYSQKTQMINIFYDALEKEAN